VVGWPEINSNRNPYERDLAARLGFNLAPAIARSEPAELIDCFGLSNLALLSEFLEVCMRRFRIMAEILDRRR
jgi:hypothetical protein